MRLAPILAAGAAAALSLAVAGCGEERDVTRTLPVPVPPAITDPRADAVAEVSLVDYALDAATSRVPRPGLIAFVATNDGLVRHALAVDGPSGAIRTPLLRLGERATFGIRLPAGTYKWYCPVADHEQRGMVGRIRIAE